MEAEEGLVKEEGGERDAVDLERGLHGVERIVMSEEDLGESVGILR